MDIFDIKVQEAAREKVMKHQLEAYLFIKNMKKIQIIIQKIVIVNILTTSISQSIGWNVDWAFDKHNTHD